MIGSKLRDWREPSVASLARDSRGGRHSASGGNSTSGTRESDRLEQIRAGRSKLADRVKRLGDLVNVGRGNAGDTASSSALLEAGAVGGLVGADAVLGALLDKGERDGENGMETCESDYVNGTRVRLCLYRRNPLPKHRKRCP